MKKHLWNPSVLVALALSIAVALPASAARRDRSPDIVDAAVANGSFETLVAAVQAADLVDALKSDGPFTVFAPTDEAFAKLPKGTLQLLLQPANKGVLTEILTYHVVSGSVLAADAAGLGSAKTVAGPKVNIGIDGGRLQINDSNVVINDLEVSNGVIHVIDQVLLPPGVTDRLTDANARKVIGVYVERPDRALAAQLDLDRHEALLVTGVTSSGAARRAGLEKYDVITRIDGRVANSDNLAWAKNERGIGGEIVLEVLRRGRSVSLDVEVEAARH